jgi:predicted peptidase
VYLPPGYTAERTWPVLLFLHGRGNGGNVRTMAVDLGAAVRKSPGLYPCIIVLPECPLLDMWIGPMIRYAVTAMDRAALEFHGDTARLYVSGISMGGYGTFICAVDYPGKFAALAPLCGGVIPPFRFSQAVYRRMSASCREVLAAKDPYARLADFVGKTPLWLFHSADDPVIPATESRNIAAALKAAGDSVRFTEYKNLGHEIGYATYSDPQLADWLLKQRLPCP